MRIQPPLVIITLAFLFSISCERWHSPAPATKSPELKRPFIEANGVQFKGRALSLRILQERLKDCVTRNSCSSDLLLLCGITKLLGYVVDEQYRDIVLFGETNGDFPALHTEDFAIALRNSWLLYAPLERNTITYSPPFCDIRPHGDILRKLNTVMNDITGRPSQKQTEDALVRWREVCDEPQTVTVGGIPQQSRFGAVMVEADYYMKRLVDGSDSLHVQGFISLLDMAMDIMKSQVEKGKSVSLPIHPFNRFEFYPGENTFLEGDHILYLQKSEVTLVTEEQFLTKSDATVGSNRPDPFAEKFAQNFTYRYDVIAKEKPIYAELEGLFRYVAIAKAMRLKDTPSAAGIDLDYLLKVLPLGRVEVPETLPGISNVKRFRHRVDIENGYRESYLWVPSCGGVRIDININENSFVRKRGEDLHEILEEVKRTRASPDQLTWDFRAKWIN